ncbi:MAG: RNA polymerase sigma factor [Blastocatellia bacterium]
MKDRRGLRGVPPLVEVETGPETGPDTSEDEDLALVRRFQRSGDMAAFEAIFRRHQQAVARLCLSLLRSRAEAEDATQEVFLRVYLHLPAFEPRAALRAWLNRIAVNHCRNLLEQRARRAEDYDTGALAALAIIPPQETSLVHAMLFDAALARLGPEARLAFSLHAVEGYSIAETADLLDIGYEAAASRIRRAYQQFTSAWAALRLPGTGEKE